VTTFVTGDIGTNVGTTSGYDPTKVSGTIHSSPDGSIQQCADDLLLAYSYLNTLPHDIELLYPAQFGNNLVLTPHTYLMSGAATFTDTVVLNAQGNADAVFVIKINGAMTTSTYATVKLINGTQAKNVYWKIEGAVTINNYSVFNGTIISNNGALGAINTGIVLNGRALTTNGALNTTAVNVTSPTIPANCASLGLGSLDDLEDVATFYPNPFSSSTSIRLINSNFSKDMNLQIFNMLGEEVMHKRIKDEVTLLETTGLNSGVYYYILSNKDKTLQTGKLIAQ